MSIDEQVLHEYLLGWLSGASAADGKDHYPIPGDSYERGYAAGRAAYLAAEQAERERLERCPTCKGSGEGEFNRPRLRFDECPACHGTGRRP